MHLAGSVILSTTILCIRCECAFYSSVVTTASLTFMHNTLHTTHNLYSHKTCIPDFFKNLKQMLQNFLTTCRTSSMCTTQHNDIFSKLKPQRVLPVLQGNSRHYYCMR